MSTSALATVLDAIQAGLTSRPGLSDVNVFSGPVTEEEGGPECIWFDEAMLTEYAFAMGGDVSESWNISGEAWAEIATWQGDSEATIRRARDRVLEIWAEIETYINDTYIGSFPSVSIQGASLVSGIVPDGRRAKITFTLQMENIINP